MIEVPSVKVDESSLSTDWERELAQIVVDMHDDWRRLDGRQWMIGDHLNRQDAPGGKYERVEELFGIAKRTAEVWAHVAGVYEPTMRIVGDLTFNHHQIAASLPKRERTKLLKRAAEQGMSTRDLKAEVRQKRLEQAAEEHPLPADVYRVIYADPPWFYNDARLGTVDGGGAGAHYPTMKVDELCDMPVAERRASECALFLWATAPCLPEAMQVIDAWGFQYKAQFVWDKVRGFNGHYNDVCHELLLVATRGSFVPKHERLRKSIVSIEKSRHSKKPAEFYEIIEEMYDGPYLEMFAREERGGDWHSWGNEVGTAR